MVNYFGRVDWAFLFGVVIVRSALPGEITSILSALTCTWSFPRLSSATACLKDHQRHRRPDVLAWGTGIDPAIAFQGPGKAKRCHSQLDVTPAFYGNTRGRLGGVTESD